MLNEKYIEEKYPKRRYVDIDLSNRVYLYNEALQKYQAWEIKCSRDYWLNMDGYEFESEIAQLYRENGYVVHRTSLSGDGGIDVILYKDNLKIAVQCKHHSKPVGPHDVRALMGVVASQEFDSGIFVSLNGFTTTVYNEVKASKVPIELVTLEHILSMVNYKSPKFKPKKQNQEQKKITKSVCSNKSFVNQSKKEATDIKRVCMGNCSTCKRDHCIEEK